MTDHHCCEWLRETAEFTCDVHPAPGGCGDYLIAYNDTVDEYGLWVHDGPDGSASSSVTILFCPFCGSRLPPSRRDA